jgi:hypothetical protein
MLNFNLLPSSEKKETEIEKIKSSIISLSKIIFLLLIILTISLLSIYFYLNILVKAQEDLIEEKSQSLLYKEVQNLDREITKVNSKINKLCNIQKRFICLSPIIEEIETLIPENDVYLTRLSITPKVEVIPQEESSEDEAEALPKSETPESEEKEVKTIQKEFIEINITGFAPRRKQVLELEKLFRSSPMFSDIVSPVENIISLIDIDFNFTFRLKQ